MYDKFGPPGGLESYGRCIGHAGMPVERGHAPDLKCPWLAWDNRRYENGEDINAGYNGYTNLKLDGEIMHVEYIDLEGRLTFTEDWQVDTESGKLTGPNLRKIIDDPAVHFRQLS